MNRKILEEYHQSIQPYIELKSRILSLSNIEVVLTPEGATIQHKLTGEAKDLLVKIEEMIEYFHRVAESRMSKNRQHES